MAKGIGLIGNFKGKVGNMVGYHLKDSNNKQTQGVRVYQPIVKNPKTSAQAEQRAKLAPINATYRALKMVIDRGNEGLPYGNKSRLAWLKQAFKAAKMPWLVKGATPNFPVICQLTKGSLVGLSFDTDGDSLEISANGVTSETKLNTIGGVSTALLAAYPSLKDGDQITIVVMEHNDDGMLTSIFSFVLDTKSVEATTKFSAGVDSILFAAGVSPKFVSVIVSREGANGEHLRSTSSLVSNEEIVAAGPYDDTSKKAAIESYMSSASTNSDWAEESIK